MNRLALAFVVGLLMSLGACESVDRPPTTAAQIADRNVEARGGLEAWKAIHTMVWVGQIDSRHSPVPNLPFVLEMKRPNKTRFEIRAQGQVSTRIFDGTQGWKVHPGRGGFPVLRPYSKYEVQAALDAEGIGGPLVDYRARGVTLRLEGTEKVAGRPAYRLALKLPSGAHRRIWIDTKNFLTVKYERRSRNAFGMTGKVDVYYSNYRKFKGVSLPLSIETGSDKRDYRDKMVIERVVINPILPKVVFSKPLLPPHPPTVSIGNQPRGMTSRRLRNRLQRPASVLPAGAPVPGRQ